MTNAITVHIRDLLADRSRAVSDDLAVRASWFDEKAQLFQALAEHEESSESTRADSYAAADKARAHAAQLRADITPPYGGTPVGMPLDDDDEEPRRHER